MSYRCVRDKMCDNYKFTRGYNKMYFLILIFLSLCFLVTGWSWKPSVSFGRRFSWPRIPSTSTTTFPIPDYRPAWTAQCWYHIGTGTAISTASDPGRWYHSRYPVSTVPSTVPNTTYGPYFCTARQTNIPSTPGNILFLLFSF